MITAHRHVLSCSAVIFHPSRLNFCDSGNHVNNSDTHIHFHSVLIFLILCVNAICGTLGPQNVDLDPSRSSNEPFSSISDAN